MFAGRYLKIAPSLQKSTPAPHDSPLYPNFLQPSWHHSYLGFLGRFNNQVECNADHDFDWASAANLASSQLARCEESVSAALASLLQAFTQHIGAKFSVIHQFPTDGHTLQRCTMDIAVCRSQYWDDDEVDAVCAICEVKKGNQSSDDAAFQALAYAQLRLETLWKRESELGSGNNYKYGMHFVMTIDRDLEIYGTIPMEREGNLLGMCKLVQCPLEERARVGAALRVMFDCLGDLVPLAEGLAFPHPVDGDLTQLGENVICKGGKTVYKLFDYSRRENENERRTPNADIICSVYENGAEANQIFPIIVFLTYAYKRGSHEPKSWIQMQKLGLDLKKLHDQNFVHGDVRAVNMIFDDGENAWLIDFDWANKDQSTYPECFNTKDIPERHIDAAPGKPMRKNHDWWALVKIAAHFFEVECPSADMNEDTTFQWLKCNNAAQKRDPPRGHDGWIPHSEATNSPVRAQATSPIQDSKPKRSGPSAPRGSKRQRN